MKIKEWVELLMQQDQEAELILWEWINNKSVFSTLEIGGTQGRVKDTFLVRGSQANIAFDLTELMDLIK